MAVKTKSILVMFIVTFFLGGCATIADYSEPVSRLEKAINDSATSIEAIDTDITARQNRKLKEKIIAGSLLLDATNNECAAGKDNCSLIVLQETEGVAKAVSAYPLKSSMPKAIEAMDQVKMYVGRLKSIVDADTAAKVTASANATLGSLEEIANQIANESGQASISKNKITEYKEPVMGLIEWITNKHVERVKKEALAKATRDAQPVIEGLTTFYATAAQSQKLAEFSGFHDSFIKNQEKFDDIPVTSSAVDSYVLAAANYQVALKAQAANPLKAFETAHEKLKKQLNGEDDKKTTLADVAAAIERLEQEVKKIKELVDSFKKSNDTNNGDQS
jgi:archaellum component FlaC